KRLEPFYAFERIQPLDRAGEALRVVQRSLELGATPASDDEHARVVADYNRDDCLSTVALRDWLEARRPEGRAAGGGGGRPAERSGAPSESIDERERRTRALAERLLAGIPDEPAERTPEQAGQALLAHLLDWHRREEKAPWWEYFRLRELSDADLLDET